MDVAVALLKSGVRAHVLKGGLPEWVGASLPTETKDAVRAVPPQSGRSATGQGRTSSRRDGRAAAGPGRRAAAKAAPPAGETAAPAGPGSAAPKT